MKAYVVEKEALSHNIELLQKMANGVPIWAVLKGNGYGIGVLPLARHLAEAGIDHFCVTEVREAELLRENGFEDAAILMLRSTGDPAELNRLMDLRVILTIGSWETACAINAIAAERADVVEAHLKIDTGMGRYGFLPEDMDHILGVYREQKNIAVSGVYTHFNCAFGSKKLTHQEFETFRKTVSAIREAGFETGTVHCCNSSAFLRFPEMHCDGVRLGSWPRALPHKAAPRRLCRGACGGAAHPAEGPPDRLRRHVDRKRGHAGRHCPHRLVQRLPRALRRRHHTLPRLPEPHSAWPARDLFPRPAARGGQRA